MECGYCHRPLLASLGGEMSTAYCEYCRVTWALFPIFPAVLDYEKEPILPRLFKEGNEASCYNHETNLACSGCEFCGRLICEVCECRRFGKVYCPSCWGAERPETKHETIARWRQQRGSVRSSAFEKQMATLYAPDSILGVLKSGEGVYFATDHILVTESMMPDKDCVRLMNRDIRYVAVDHEKSNGRLVWLIGITLALGILAVVAAVLFTIYLDGRHARPAFFVAILLLICSGGFSRSLSRRGYMVVTDVQSLLLPISNRHPPELVIQRFKELVGTKV